MRALASLMRLLFARLRYSVVCSFPVFSLSLASAPEERVVIG